MRTVPWSILHEIETDDGMILSISLVMNDTKFVSCFGENCWRPIPPKYIWVIFVVSVFSFFIISAFNVVIFIKERRSRANVIMVYLHYNIEVNGRN